MVGSDMMSESVPIFLHALRWLCAWAGYRRPPQTRIPDWFVHARRALRGGPEASRYTYSIGPAAGAEEKLRVLTRSRVLSWTWLSAQELADA